MLSYLQRLLAFIGLTLPSLEDATQQSLSSPLPTALPIRERTETSHEGAVPCAIQREIREQRKFSLAEAIGREGGSLLKGESTIPRPLRAITEINQFITTHMSDPTSALTTTLQAWAGDDIRVSRQLDTPLVALAQMVESILTQPTMLCEFARQVAIAHSQLTGDDIVFPSPIRPRQLLNQLPREPAYPCTAISSELSTLLEQLQNHQADRLQPSSP